MKNLLVSILGIGGFVLASGAIGRLETDLYYPMWQAALMVVIGLVMMFFALVFCKGWEE